jgi:hypothetical protein
MPEKYINYSNHWMIGVLSSQQHMENPPCVDVPIENCPFLG